VAVNIFFMFKIFSVTLESSQRDMYVSRSVLEPWLIWALSQLGSAGPSLLLKLALLTFVHIPA